MKVPRDPAGVLAVLLLSVVVLCETPLLAAPSRYRVSDAPTPEWREGPIRYIITKSEDEEYRQLDDQEARQRFIDSFWRRRDPTPDTPGNEFRATFWRRVRRANSLHGKDTPKPGWLTDMGKIYILFGPPDEISRDEMAEGRRGIIVWMYRNTPGVGPNKVLAGANQVIAFAQDGSNEYRLTAEPTKMADVWEGLPDPQPPSGIMATYKAQQKAFQEAYGEYIGLTDPVIRAHGGPAQGGALGLTMLLGRLQQPPKEWELTSEIRTREFFGALPFRARADFFRLGDGRAEILITLAVRSTVVTYRTTSRGDEPAVQAYGTVFDSTGTTRIASIEQVGGFTPARENLSAGLDDDLLFQARLILKPGAYRAHLTVLDEVSGRSSSSETPFTVPDFGKPGLEMSSVSLARSIESAESKDRAFRLGKLRVLPRMADAFEAGDELAFYYQIYGADRAPETGEPRLDVSYIFMAAQGEEIQEIGRILFEDQTAEAHGYALPLEGWPAGSYLVRIEVADAIGVQEASREIAFRILEKPGTTPQP